MVQIFLHILLPDIHRIFDHPIRMASLQPAKDMETERYFEVKRNKEKECFHVSIFRTTEFHIWIEGSEN